MDGGSWYFTEGSDQDHPQEKEVWKGKMVVWGALPYTEKRKGKGEKETYIYLNAEFQRVAMRDKKAFLCDQSKEIEGERQEKDQLGDWDQLGLTYTYHYI